ncbi:hypothetical protein GGI35DRAFT_173546 [Trichoderma velutinum]
MKIQSNRSECSASITTNDRSVPLVHVDAWILSKTHPLTCPKKALDLAPTCALSLSQTFPSWVVVKGVRRRKYRPRKMRDGTRRKVQIIYLLSLVDSFCFFNCTYLFVVACSVTNCVQMHLLLPLALAKSGFFKSKFKISAHHHCITTPLDYFYTTAIRDDHT